jgi:hypothetical protein
VSSSAVKSQRYQWLLGFGEGHHPGSKHVAPRFIPKVAKAFGFDLTYTVSTLHQRFTCVRLLDRHMTRSSRAFSMTLTILAFDQRSLWLFEACSCKPASEGLPSSLTHLRQQYPARRRLTNYGSWESKNFTLQKHTITAKPANSLAISRASHYILGAWDILI